MVNQLPELVILSEKSAYSSGIRNPANYFKES